MTDSPKGLLSELIDHESLSTRKMIIEMIADKRIDNTLTIPQGRLVALDPSTYQRAIKAYILGLRGEAKPSEHTYPDTITAAYELGRADRDLPLRELV